MDGVVTGRLGEPVGRGGVCVLSGAGLSTESGIPDYRGPSGVLRARLPMTIAEFRGSPEARQRYWARVHIGRRRIVAAHADETMRHSSVVQERDLEHDIKTLAFQARKDYRFAVELYGALCNAEWRHDDGTEWPGGTWRYVANVVAHLRGRAEDYTDFIARAARVRSQNAPWKRRRLDGVASVTVSGFAPSTRFRAGSRFSSTMGNGSSSGAAPTSFRPRSQHDR